MALMAQAWLGAAPYGLSLWATYLKISTMANSFLSAARRLFRLKRPRCSAAERSKPNTCSAALVDVAVSTARGETA